MPMLASSQTAPRTGGYAERTAALVDALGSERRLLDELVRVLSRQREGVAQNDLDTLDGSVYDAQRVFLTLQQARRRRRTLIELVVGRDGVSLGEIESALGDRASGHLLAARDELIESARRLARELDMNRRILDGAMAMGDEVIRVLTGEGAAPAVYTSGEPSEKRGSAGKIVNTRA